jgi:ubiquinone/menaquinone biosynthesis C-methylase UbiE
MEYDTDFWNKYTDENESNYNQEYAKFIRDLATSLRASSVLEVGCNSGNDLKEFPENFEVHGIDLNEHALDIAKKKLPSFKFKKGSILNIPFEDSSIDFVFTHYLLNYLPEQEIEKAIKELFRVSRKYILTCELFDENESPLEGDVKAWKRNVYKKWLNFQVKIISDVDIHEDIEPKKPRFTLVKKIR